MNKSYFDLEPDDQRALLRVAEDKLGLSDTVIEKDPDFCQNLNNSQSPKRTH